jgi:hypothetical protein
MSTLEVETEIKNTVQATEAVELVDCGRATERTNGNFLFFLYESSTPPANKLFL